MSFEEQIMSKDKYPSIFSPQMEAKNGGYSVTWFRPKEKSLMDYNV